MAAVVPVGGVYPVGSQVSITGQVTSGDGHLVGGVQGWQFGTPSFRLSKGVVGVQTAQAFGAVSVRVVTTVPVGGVGSAQSFGALRFAFKVPITGVSTAQSFGALGFKTAVTVALGGAPSAQSFGAVTPKAVYRLTPAGVGSAQAFGNLGFRTNVTLQVPGVPPPLISYTAITNRFAVGHQVVLGTVGTQFGQVRIGVYVAVPGVPSAASFGSPAVRVVQFVTLLGVNSAQSFGTPYIAFRQIVQVGGVPPSGVWIQGTITGQWLTGQAICGADYYTQFGRVYVYLRWQPVTVGGAPSAQRFGALTIKPGPVTVVVVGVGTAQQFGQPQVYIAWFKPPLPCEDMSLAAITCTDLTLAGLVASDINLTASACTDLTLTPITCSTLDLEPVEAE